MVKNGMYLTSKDKKLGKSNHISRERITMYALNWNVCCIKQS